MEARAAGSTQEMGFLSGYGAHIRALRQEDLTERSIELQDHRFADCVAVEGEDMATDLAAVVDLRTMTVVWSQIPHTHDNGKTLTTAPIPSNLEPDFAKAIWFLVKALLPEVPVPERE